MKHTLTEKKIDKVHTEIAKLANRIVMRVDHEFVNVDITKEWQTIAPSVDSIECALNGDDCTVLNVRFDKGGIIKKHSHTNKETIFVISGEIYDTISKITTKEGQSYVIPENQEHEIVSDYAKLAVVFKPPFLKVQI